MTLSTTRLVAILLTALMPVVASASVDMFLQIKPEKGEARLVRCSDGSCASEPLPAGTWSVAVCTARGKVIPTDLSLEYAVVGPRDSASGMATGKRQHGSITITKEWDRAATGNRIAIQEDGTQLAIGTSGAAVEAAQAKIGKSRSNIQNN